MSLTSQEKYDAPEKDELYDLLSSHRRRYVLHACKQHDGSVTLSELADQIAAWEHDKTVGEITSAERKRVYTSLQQTHLNRMAEAGMIRYEGDEIELTDEAEGLDVYLDIVPPQSIPWGVYYLGLSVLGAVVLAGVWVGFVPTGTVPALGWATIVLAAFMLSAVGQVVQNRRHRLDRFDRPP